ncbi:MAG: integrase, partial [Candidatus Thermofonsia Clade 3 bacterium]
YAADIDRLLAFTGAKPLAATTLADLQSFAESLTALSASSRKRTINAVKSLLSFGQKVGYLRFNVGAALKAPKPKNTLAQRILSESEVHAMIALTHNVRDKTLLMVLYASGARVSEACALTWGDVQANGESGQITLFGKGGKTRNVVLSTAVWRALLALRPERATADDFVFVSRRGGRLDETQVFRIVRAAARRAGVAGNVSPHWLRHSHATHALARGAGATLVRDTLGHSSLSVTSMYAHARPSESSALYLAV